MFSPNLIIRAALLLGLSDCTTTSGSRAKPCLFSPLSGTITLSGEPASDAKLIRTAGKAHTHGEFVDTTTTDKQGRFEVPTVFERVLLAKFLPMEFVAPLEILVEYQGNSIRFFWGEQQLIRSPVDAPLWLLAS